MVTRATEGTAVTVDLYPSSWADAASAVREEGTVVVAGGTGIQPWLNTATDRPTALVHLSRVAQAWDAEHSAGELTIGAMVAVDHPVLTPCFGGEGIGWFATPAVRRRATAVGNVVSRLGPRELATPLVALGARLHSHGHAGSWQSVEEVLREGLPPGRLATRLRLHIPERIVYHRMSARRRLSRVELGVCAALGPGCGAAIVIGSGAAAVRVDTTDSGAANFVAAIRAQAAAMSDNARRIATVTALAARVHRDLHGRTGR